MSENNKPKVDHIIEFIEKNRSLILSSVIIVFLISVGLAGFNVYKEKQQVKAYSELFSIEKNLKKLAEEKSEKTDYTQVLQQLNQFVSSNNGNNAKYFAAIEASEVHLNKGQTDKAFEVIANVTQGMDSQIIFYGLLHLYQATLAMDLEKYDQALASLNQVVMHNEFKFLHPEALVKQGICYQKLNKLDQAKNTYIRVSEEFKDTAAAQNAKVYLRMLQLNEG